MRFLLIAVCLLWMVASRVAAQQKPDIIIKRDGTKIEGMVSTVSPTEIFYGTADMPTNVFKTVPVSEVAAILYRDGKVQNFEALAAPAAQPEPPSPSGYATPPPAPADAHLQFGETAAPTKAPFELYTLGKRDADQYYTRYGGARAGALVSSALTGGLIGLIPAIAISTTPPARHNWDVPPSPYATDPNYLQGYKEAARKKKSRKTWGGYGIGVGIGVVLFLILTSE